MKPKSTLLAIAIPLALCAGHADARHFSQWQDPNPVDAVNSIAADGCPIESRDGLSLYIASSRSVPGALGKLDLYRATRRSVEANWGAPANLGAPVNSTEFDYCPTPLQGKWLMFVSSRQTDDDCFPGDVAPPPPPGGPSAGDIYLTREHPVHGWQTPLNLGCYPQGPNTAGAEFSPSLVETSEGTFLYFSSNGYLDSQSQDIYMSRVLDNGTVLPGVRVAELSTLFDDRMPNVRKDGLEIVFSSNRAGASAFDQDIYVATRTSTAAPWQAPERINNPAINTPGSETRASLSGDGTRLYFGRKINASDPGDVFVSVRASK